MDATSLAALGLARLDDTLVWASSHGVAVNVEIKRDVPRPLALCRAVARVVDRTKADVLLSSFDPALVAAMAALLPRTPRAWLLHPQHGRASLTATRALSRHLLRALHPERTMITPALVARWKRRGLAIGTYTVNDCDEGVRLARLGVDWIVSDTPGAMIAAMNGAAR